MNKIIKTFILIGVLCSFTSRAFATHYKLFILTGQSNSLGTTNGGEADPSSGSDAADQHVLFSWHNVVNDTTSLGHSGLTLEPEQTTANFTTLQDQQGGYYGGSATHWGPEINFARTLYRAGVRDFGVVKVSRGGGGNTNWHKDSNGHMYSQILETVGEAVASLPDGDTYEIVGMLYLQGESDNASEAAIAGERLKELTDNLRADLANATDLHTVSAGTTAAGGDSNTSREATASVTSYIDFFPNLDLTDQLGPDGLHLNKEGKFTVGDRFAQAFLNSGIVNRQYGKLVFIGDSITQGGNGDHPSYRYQVFKNLANAGVTNIAATGYEFVGSQTGAYTGGGGGTVTTPDVGGQSFVNKHDGHYGWRASWENARVALPAGRYNTNNLGQGTLLNWTAQSTTFETADQGTLTYTGSSYIPDTAVIKIGINDLSDGTSATQIRDDISLLIDQLRIANANVRVHLSQVLYSNNVSYSSVDTLNNLLPQLVADKNSSSSTSPVWLITANEGFNATTMTYDNTHPNASGEEYVGDRMSGGLGIIEMPQAAQSDIRLGEPRKTTELSTTFEGNEIYDGSSYVNGWSEVTGAAVTETLNGTDLNRTHTSGDGAWLEGQDSTKDGGTTTWADAINQDWTWEARLRINDCSNGVILWIGTGGGRILVEIYNDRTQNTGGSYSATHTNNDGEFHIWRIAHDADAQKYALWRDGVLLTDVGGVNYDGSADGRMIIGDYTGGTFGDYHNIDIDYIAYDQTGAHPPYDGSNRTPVWTSNPLEKATAVADWAYSATLSVDCSDLDNDTLTYSKVFGPEWLKVATDGTLSGSPTSDDVGPNNWKVEVTDGVTAPAQATLNITVEAEFVPDTLAVHFEGNEIYDGSNYVNGWSEYAGAQVSETLTDTNLNRTQSGGGATWLEGRYSSKDGGTTSWEKANNGDWTFEAKVKVNDSPNGFVIWLGTGNDVAIIEIYNDRTQDNGGQAFISSHTNNDGNFHTWRVTNDSATNKYHVWRDGILLTPAEGAAYDSTNNDERMIIGDYTSGTFGNAHNIDIDYISYDQTGAYQPPTPPAPTWNSNPINEINAMENVNYESTLADDATDTDSASLKFEKVSGPDWLTVGTDGTLSGTPTDADIGEKSWTVSVTDGTTTVHATLNITVESYTPARGIQLNMLDEILRWTVEVEENVAMYRIERKVNGIWSLYETVNADGSTHYQLTVELPGQYRLVVVDIDGYEQTFNPIDGNIITVTTELKEGWNLLALPVENADLSDLSNVWLWNGSNYQLGIPKPLEGFWVYTKKATQINITGEIIKDPVINLNSGWNLVGPSDNTKVLEDLTVYTYDITYNKIITDHEMLIQGRGYWVFATEPQKLQISVSSTQQGLQ